MEEYDESQPMPFMGGGHSSEGSLKFQIDSSDILEELEHSLKAERPVLENGQYTWKTPKEAKPLINELGLNNIMTVLRSRLTKIFILSDLDQQQIENITIGIGHNIIDDLHFNWNAYEIKDTAAASTILALVTDTVYATLRKGHQGNYLKFLKSIQHIQEVKHSSSRDIPAEPGGGGTSKLLDMIPFTKKRK